jgi:hypothetical protein
MRTDRVASCFDLAPNGLWFSGASISARRIQCCGVEGQNSQCIAISYAHDFCGERGGLHGSQVEAKYCNECEFQCWVKVSHFKHIVFAVG